MDLNFLSIIEAGDLLAKGEITAAALTQACLERIERLDPLLNSFITRTADLAVTQARRPKPGSPLSGIPIAVKDLFETAGVRTTAGCLFFADNVPQRNAFVVERLVSDGAVLLGKLNMHEIALGLTNVNPHYGTCHNPWDRSRISGGSSGGCAAALAAGFCLGSLGSDTGGSVRVPAALCGVVGLKPTYGRVSLRGVMPLSLNMDHVGPMGRSVRDVAILLQVVAGYDPDDPLSIEAPVDDYVGLLDEGVRGWRAALGVGEYFREGDGDVLEAVMAAVHVLARLGVEIVEVNLDCLREAALANGLLVQSEAAFVHRERLRSRPELFGQDVRQRLQTGAACPTYDYIQARRTQVEIRRKFERLLQDFDVLITPTTPVPAPPIQAADAIEQARRLTRFTAPFNLSGLPALSLPCGFTGSGLPIGLQVVAAAWAEQKVLRVGQAYEQATDWHTRHPVL